MDRHEQPIHEIMTTPVRSVTADTPAREAASVLLEEGIGSVVVADADGIVTKTDLLAGIEEQRLEAPVSELMTDPVVTVSPDADVQTAIDRMHEYEIKRLVVESGTEAVGIVSTTDLRRALATDLDSVIGLFAGSVDSDSEQTYECISCGERVTAASKPGTCHACDAPMRNLSVPRN
ncbi:rubrerythrin-like domain-containing protein [Halobellus ruber]|uniref:Rubrerythrin-like domain-containing protein n=1 Tax=Halobellus ruber TaxID=2761102 RepID=A0A7J9SML8_9EURY|nr:rubrerythrin-like domain-containing protein [Halobellus ruber]MBB6647277.1 rubrerythrin-like domain-containing protein [Halobellus ruber]